MTKECNSVFIADDHTLVRNSVIQIIGDLDGFEVTGQAGDGLAAIAGIKNLQPDLAIVDMALPLANGLEVLVEAQRWSPDTAFVILTGMSSRGLLAEADSIGAAGIFLKSDDPGEIARELPRVLTDPPRRSASVMAILTSKSDGFELLTDREHQILQGIVAGRNNAKIADRLGISVNTVVNHRANLMRKLEVSSMAELLALAVAEGLVDGARHTTP